MGGGELLAEGVSRIVRIGVNAAFPLRCWQCDSFYLLRGTEGYMTGDDEVCLFGRLMETYLCPSCADGYAPVGQPLCLICGRPFPTDHGEDHTCPDCLDLSMVFEEARAAGAYDQPLKTLHLFKYRGRVELARPLGRLLWGAFMRFYTPHGFDLIVPMPLHWFRRLRRGFNQAALLVGDWHKYAAESDIVWNRRSVVHHIVLRRRRTAAQTGLGRRERAANLKDAFIVPHTQDVRGKRILLVDDVMTTGATAVECTKALISAGAASVKVLTLARAV